MNLPGGMSRNFMPMLLVVSTGTPNCFADASWASLASNEALAAGLGCVRILRRRTPTEQMRHPGELHYGQGDHGKQHDCRRHGHPLPPPGPPRLTARNAAVILQLGLALSWASQSASTSATSRADW